MPISIPDVKFELSMVYKTYVDQLLLAGNVSSFLLSNTNIDSAGEQIEGSLRVLLSNLLPDRVSVGHGYIVDKTTSISYQQDIMVTENFYTKSLIKTLDGTEFFPYESVIATGEVKKSWSSKNLKSLIKSIARNKNDLKRNPIPSNELATGSSFIKLPNPVTNNPLRNPLFSFYFSLDYDKSFTPKSISKIYNNQNNETALPNIAVILKRGIYIMVDEQKLAENEFTIILYPEFAKSNKKGRWIFLKLEPEASLAYLIFMLTQHINDTVLEKVSSMEYGQALIDINPANISPL